LKSGNISSRKAEITDLEVTVGVNKEVPGLEITMINASRMNVLESSQNLIQEELDVIVCKLLV